MWVSWGNIPDRGKSSSQAPGGREWLVGNSKEMRWNSRRSEGSKEAGRCLYCGQWDWLLESVDLAGTLTPWGRFGCCVGTRLQDRQRALPGCQPGGLCRKGASDKVTMMSRLKGLDIWRFFWWAGCGTWEDRTCRWRAGVAVSREGKALGEGGLQKKCVRVQS